MQSLLKFKRIFWTFLTVQCLVFIYCLQFDYYNFHARNEINNVNQKKGISADEMQNTNWRLETTLAEKKFNITKQIADMVTMSEVECREKMIRLSEKPLPVVGLLSFPGSGSTWLRHLIQQMTGIGTSSVYCDGGLRNNGFPFECHPGNRTIVVKTHLYGKDNLIHYQKLILLIRNPCDAILSYLQFATAGHTGRGETEKIISAKGKLLSVSTKWYQDNIRKAREFRGPLHIVQYENLKWDLPKELAELAAFLYPDVTSEDILCTVKFQEGRYHRRNNTTEKELLMQKIYSKSDILTMNEIATESEQNIQYFYGKQFHLKCL